MLPPQDIDDVRGVGLVTYHSPIFRTHDGPKLGPPRAQDGHTLGLLSAHDGPKFGPRIGP
jgi:hypothetical protein